MNRDIKKHWPALALATSLLCGAFNGAAAQNVDAALAATMPPSNGSYLTFPDDRKPKSMRDRITAYEQYCENYPDGCLNIDRKAEIIQLTPDSWQKLQTVFKRVRNGMLIVEDFKKYPLPNYKKDGYERAPDVWTRGEDDQGDCEDFVLRWEKEMREAGFPASALLKTVLQSTEVEETIIEGKKYTFKQAHLVLTIRTDYGDFIADISNDDRALYPLSKLDKKWGIDLVESPQNMTHFYKAEIVNPTVTVADKAQDRFPALRYTTAGGG